MRKAGIFQYLSAKYGNGLNTHKEDSPEFTIGIVTYIVRFPMLKTLLKKVHKAFPDMQIIIAVNGYYNQDLQQKFLVRIADYIKSFPNVSLIPHSEAQGLCRLWNEVIIAAKNEKILILNDDLDIAPHFGDVFLASGILCREIALINESWSHFLISKSVVERVGWFDERLYGVGGEDWDYEARLVFTVVSLDMVPMKGILNLSIHTTDFSFGEAVETVHYKYTMSSALFLRQKWDFSDPDDSRARFVRIWNGYVQLNRGFETPVFYDFALLRREKDAEEKVFNQTGKSSEFLLMRS